MFKECMIGVGCSLKVVDEAEALVRWCLWSFVILLYSSAVDGQWDGVLEKTVLLPPFSQLVHLLHTSSSLLLMRPTAVGLVELWLGGSGG